MSITPHYPLLIIETATNEMTVELKTSANDTVSVNVPNDRYLGRTILEAIAEVLQQSPPRFAQVQLKTKSGHPAAVRTSTVVATLLAWAKATTVNTSNDTLNTTNSLDPLS